MVYESQVKELHFVDDSDTEILITKMILKKDDVSVDLHSYVKASDFFEHLERDAEQHRDTSLVVFDLNLGIGTGIEAIRSLRSDRRFDDLIVGICSGSDDPKDERDALNAGADFFVTKPLRGASLEKICSAVASLTYDASPGQPARIFRSSA
ncbi:MAG: response regulator [Pseudomonadota bacterium]